MPHFDPLGFEILGVVRICFTPDRHLLDHLDAVAFQADHFLRIVREETKLAHAEIEQDLRADAVIAQVAGETEFGVCFHGIEAFLLQLVGVNFRGQADARGLPAACKRARRCLRFDLTERRVQLVAAIAAARTEDITR